MQPETRFAAPYGEQASGISQEQSAPSIIKSINQTPQVSQREKKWDIVSASVVVGGTGQFVSFIFGLVTEFVPRVFDNILLSAFIGLCVGVIAYALMKGND
ncbi:MAG: hypothetical protein AB7P14_00815 [Blastocatellales bacterium]